MKERNKKLKARKGKHFPATEKQRSKGRHRFPIWIFIILAIFFIGAESLNIFTAAATGTDFEPTQEPIDLLVTVEIGEKTETETPETADETAEPESTEATDETAEPTPYQTPEVSDETEETESPAATEELPLPAPKAEGQAEATISPAPSTAASVYAGDAFVNLPLGGNSFLSAGDASLLVVMEADNDPINGYYRSYSANATGLGSALTDLYNWGEASKCYVMYIGANMLSLANSYFADSATAGTFAALAGKIDTLILTGDANDPITWTPATVAPTRQFTTASGNKYFGCNLVIRNLTYNMGTSTGFTGNAVFMKGNDLTLGGNAWAAAATQYFGGSSSGTITPADGTATITVYATGSTDSYFAGGMQGGTLNGNTEIHIKDSYGGILYVYGGGYGTSAAPAHVTGNVSTTISGMSSARGGLRSFFGGVYYGNIGGQITNNISGAGRFADNGQTANAWTNLYAFYVGGSYRGNVGTTPAAIDPAKLLARQSSAKLPTGYSKPLLQNTDYAIFNNVDFSGFTSGATRFVGANARGGVITGNVVNIAAAGKYQKGSINAFNGGGGYDARINNGDSPTGSSYTYNGSFGVSVTGGAETANATGLVVTKTNGDTAATNGFIAAKQAASFQLLGNITNILRFGCMSANNGDDLAYFRGAGYGGYVEGNAWSNVGTEGLVYAEYKDSYKYTTADTRQAYQLAVGSNNVTGILYFDMVAGGGQNTSQTGGNSGFVIVGNTTLVTTEVLARWTYGGSFDSVQKGDTLRIHFGGVVDTCEGSGYSSYLHIGDSRAEVYSGQVDWFLSGGGWYDAYQIGNTSVEVYDNPRPDGAAGAGAIINGTMGGTFGYSSRHYITGDSTVVVHGGDFSGKPNGGESGPADGFCTGPTNSGYIFGNASMTIDLRGNQYGFKIASGNSVSAGRGYLVSNVANYLGARADNTIELNIYTDNTGTNLLNGLNIYGDTCGTLAAATYAGSTRSEHITINVNAPGSAIGNLFATNYPNVTGSGASRRLYRNVTINLVSAASLQALSAGNGFGGTGTSATNTLNDSMAAYSASYTPSAPNTVAGRAAVIHIGPQSDDPNDPLGDWETIPTNGLPPVIRVVAGSTSGVVYGINGFTEMDIKERLLVSDGAPIKNGGSNATLATHTTAAGGLLYNTSGSVTLYAGKGLKAAGIGITGTGTEAFIAANLRVIGAGTAYIQTPGAKNQAIFTDLSVEDTLTWLKVGTLATQSFSAASTWFGTTQGYYVLTLNPNQAHAKSSTPFNLEGLEESTRKTFIGDNVIPATPTTEGYAVCFPGALFAWQVTKGQGLISHNIDVYTGTEPPTNGYLQAVGTVAKDTPTTQGKIMIPSEKVPDALPYPVFSFIPNADLGEWLQAAQISRSDDLLVGRDYYATLTEQSLEAHAENRTAIWAAAGEDIYYAFQITAQFKNDAEITAQSAILTESEAAAILSAADVTAYNKAMGRPFLTSNVTEEILAAIRTPLAAGEYLRVHPIVYAVGTDEDNAVAVTVNIVVVKDGTLLSEDRSYAIYAADASMQLNQARAITEQAALDAYTHAIAILSDGTTSTATLVNESVIEDINTTDESEIPKEISPVSYAYSPDGVLPAVQKDVTVTITAKAYDFVFTKWGVGASQGEETVKVPLQGVVFVLYPRDVTGQDWDTEQGMRCISDAEGKVNFPQLSAGGEFLLVEEQTLTGYRLPFGKWQITVDENADTIAIVAVSADADTLPPAFAVDETGETPRYGLPNYKETELPVTGGMGVLLFTIGGIILIGLAIMLIFLVGKKKK